MRERLDIRIDAELREWLVATAESESRTMTHIVERALCVERHNVGHGLTAKPSAPIGKLIDTATGAETPVVQSATASSSDLVDYASGRDRPRCDSCERRGPPKSFPCKTCGHQRASK